MTHAKKESTVGEFSALNQKKNSFSLILFALKNFIITNDKNSVQKILSGLEKMTRADYKLTLVKIKIFMKANKNSSQKRNCKFK